MSATRSPETARGDSRARWAGLAFIALAVAMVISSATITNVAVPADHRRPQAELDRRIED
ncbi:hypothetical protein ACFV0L_13710 [Streptosporangium canum]|uniref:hypothetical protein n=1 Tax=Streptosporangium canum TaxID=324952 RepID=UPI0036CDC06B